MEKIRVSLDHHPELFEALNTTASPEKRAARIAAFPPRENEGAA